MVCKYWEGGGEGFRELKTQPLLSFHNSSNIKYPPLTFFVVVISVAPRDMTSWIIHGYTVMMELVYTVFCQWRFLIYLDSQWTLQVYLMVVRQMVKDLKVDGKKFAAKLELNPPQQFTQSSYKETDFFSTNRVMLNSETFIRHICGNYSILIS